MSAGAAWTFTIQMTAAPLIARERIYMTQSSSHLGQRARASWDLAAHKLQITHVSAYVSQILGPANEVTLPFFWLLAARQPNCSALFKSTAPSSSFVRENGKGIYGEAELFTRH